MKRKYMGSISVLLAMLLLLCGCAQTSDSENTKSDSSGVSTSAGDQEIADSETAEASETQESDEETESDQQTENDGMVEMQKPERSELFSDRDFETGYSEKGSTIIVLNHDTASVSSDGAVVSGSTVTITKEGTYILSGTLDDGMIVVETDKKEKVQIVLDGVTIHSETSAPIYVKQSDKVFLTLAPDSENTLSNGGTFEAIDDNGIDAVIFSKDDLTINGSGSLFLTSPAGHGIVSKDSLTVTGGTFEIDCASTGLSGKDDISIADGSFVIRSGKDGIHAENADDETLGLIYIENGTFVIESEGDGISAASGLWIEEGSYQITSGGGSENAQVQTSESWGSFKGGGRNGTKNKMEEAPEGTPGEAPEGITTGTERTSEEESSSIKGMKAGGILSIAGGTFQMDTADDAIHSNASVTVSGGSFEIAAGDDAFHADETMTISGGMITVKQSYEAIEGLHVVISGGDITVMASDDGINAAGGTDMSGMAGPRGNDKFGGGMSGGSSDGSIQITGGTIFVTAYGDGIDANGSLEISGGNVTVSGPVQGDTATLDYDTSGVITGGTFIGTSASGMAQTFSDSTQGVIAVSVGQQSEGTLITLTDNEGKEILTYTPELPFAVAILSSPELISGETYTITVGSQSGEVTAK
ncbi:MAG: carbohydrate-binding domain-containing protein [Fusicatenibacter sp.]|nr:carbohydrate-binding domain-containing protein [Fusicatenibacter sp.]